MKPKLFHVYVHHLDGEMTMELGMKRKGNDLLSMICQRLGIVEDWYFGIQYQNRKGQEKWIKMKKTVYSQIGRGKRPVVFLVKYFPDDIGSVGDPSARLLVYEHCKREILSGRLECSPEMSVLLASLAVQADYGDWDRVNYGELSVDRLVPRGVRAGYKMKPQLWSDSVLVWQKDHTGMTRSRAVVEYMKVVQNTTDYGIHYYPVGWLFKPKWLGVTAVGLQVYDESDRHVPETRLRWILIRTIRYSGREFVVKPVFNKIPDYVFRAAGKRTAKEIFGLCVGYHNIYKRTQKRREELCRRLDRREDNPPLYEDIDDQDDYQGRSQYRSDSFIMAKLPTLQEERESN